MTREVLKTKLTIPPVRTDWISRPRLIKLLSSWDNRLTIVSAPAGFGKTTILSEWARAMDHNISWLTLDEGDDDPQLFWVHFINAIQVCRPGSGKAALELLQAYGGPSSQLPPKSCLTALINDLLEEKAHLTLILDDFHLVRDRGINSDLQFFVDHMPAQFHLVFSSRARIPFSLGRLRVKGQLLEISADDLRFTPQEIALFAKRVIGGKLGEKDISALETYSEGWAAGLQIAAIALRKDDPESVPLVSRGYEHMVEYFMEEVLSSHQEDIQSFMLETSILERLNAPLCNAVTARGDSGKILETLCAGNTLIVALDEQRHEYRYHVLFGETLRNRLHKVYPERVGILHSRASRWYIDNGFPEQAIRHAIDGKDWYHAIYLVNKYAGIALLRGESSTALRWMQSLPPGSITSHSGLCTGFAWGLFLSHLRSKTEMPYDRIEQYLKDAEMAQLEKNPDTAHISKHDRQVMGHANALRVYLAFERGDPAQKVIDLCNRSMSGTDGHFPIVQAGVHTILGMTYMGIGKLESAAKAFDAARAVAFAEGMCFTVVSLDCLRAFLAKFRGRLQESELICRKSINNLSEEFVRQGRLLPEMLGLVRMVMAAVHIEKGETEKAGEILHEIRSLISLIDHAAIIYHTLCARLMLSQKAEFRDVISPLAEISLMELSYPGAEAYSVALRIRYLLHRQGNKLSVIDSAFHLADQHGLHLHDKTRRSTSPLSRYFHYIQQYALVRLHIAEAISRHHGQSRLSLQEIIRSIEALCADARKEGWGELEIEGFLLLSEAYFAHSNPDEAMVALERTFSLAEPEGYERIFIEEGMFIKDVLIHACAQGVYKEFSGRLLEGIEKEYSKERQPAVRTDDLFDGKIEPLSKQEITILKLIAEGLSNQEIADELCIALTTVKVHNYNLFSKLNVGNRLQAVKKAKELNLM